MDLKKFIKESGNEYASIVEEGVAAGDVHSYIDTGSYLFNALLSGSLHGGLPSNKITALAGESATGKTYFAQEWSNNSWMQIQMQEYYTLSLNLQYQKNLWTLGELTLREW